MSAVFYFCLLAIFNHQFNLHPEKWFEGYPVKSTQIYIGCHLRCYTKKYQCACLISFSDLYVWHPAFFKLPPWKKIWVNANLKKSQVSPYKNLGRFYRVPFKSLLRVQIKRMCVNALKSNQARAKRSLLPLNIKEIQTLALHFSW